MGTSSPRPCFVMLTVPSSYSVFLHQPLPSVTLLLCFFTYTEYIRYPPILSVRLSDKR